MAKLTLLQIVQSILNDMGSDKVNSISDTVESEQVASIVKDTYFNLLNTIDKVPENFELIKLEALGDSTRPNYLKIPSNVLRIEKIRYDISTDSNKRYAEMLYYSPEEFLDRIYTRNTSASNIIEVNDVDNSEVVLLIQNDKRPDFYTIFNDDYIVFDSYDSVVDDTLEEDKSLCYAQIEPSWTTSDTFVPDLDSNLFPLLLAEAKSTCFVNIKEAANAKIEQVSRNQKVSLQNNKKKTKDRYCYPNYGR